MINFFKSNAEGRIEKTDGICKGCWIDVVEPTPEDKEWLENELEIAPEFIVSAFDDEETSHVDVDDETGQVLVIVDCPFPEAENEKDSKTVRQYDTHPLSFVFVPDEHYLLTLSLRRNDAVAAFAFGKEKDCATEKRAQFFLKMLLKITKRYMVCLRSIHRQMRSSEKELRKTMRNSELMSMLGLEKSLVYFSTSLKGLESTIMRIGQGRIIELWEDDEELLDDVRIEVRQAVEMCTIYTNILNSITDTFSSIINNTLNFTMKTLTAITVIFTLPTMVFSFYGMNVEGLPFIFSYWPALLIAAVLMVVAIIVLKCTKFLK